MRTESKQKQRQQQHLQNKSASSGNLIDELKKSSKHLKPKNYLEEMEVDLDFTPKETEFLKFAKESGYRA